MIRSPTLEQNPTKNDALIYTSFSHYHVSPLSFISKFLGGCVQTYVFYFLATHCKVHSSHIHIVYVRISSALEIIPRSFYLTAEQHLTTFNTIAIYFPS